MRYLHYAFIEIVLPGGTLLAVGLWIYRNRRYISQALSNWLSAVRLLGSGERI
jgi:hypothetical protein